MVLRALLLLLLRFLSELFQRKHNNSTYNSLLKVISCEYSLNVFFRPKPISITRPFYFTVSSKCWNMKSKQNNHMGCPYGNVPVFVGKVVNPAE